MSLKLSAFSEILFRDCLPLLTKNVGGESLNHFRLRTGVMCLVCLAGSAVWGQRVERAHGERLIAVVPLIGAGTATDPRRPLFVPNPNEVSAAIAQGQTPPFTSCHFVMADDGKSAIVEYVAATRNGLKAILDAGTSGSVAVFDPHHTTAASVNQKLKQLKAGFDLLQFRGVLSPQIPASTQAVGGSN